MSKQLMRTTLALPADLLSQVDEAVRSGKARSRNELVCTAIRRELDLFERTAIDAAFSMMASDADYAAETEAVAKEFADADWEAFQIGERQYAGRDDATR